MSEPKIVSKLASSKKPRGNATEAVRKAGAPVRGVGAAYTENQRLAGAADPDTAAAVAALPPDVAARVATAAEEEENELREMAAELIQAADRGEIDLTPQVRHSISSGHSGTIRGRYELLKEQREAEVDQEMEGSASVGGGSSNNLLEELRIQPDDPMYVPLRDRIRRESIEARLDPLDFDSMVFQGYTEQRIPIRTGFEVVLRSISTDHSLWLEELASEQSGMGNPQHTMHWFALAQVAIALQSINARPIENNVADTKDKDHFRTTLTARMRYIGRLPSVVTDDLITHYTWFVGRLRKLMTGDVTRRVGNS